MNTQMEKLALDAQYNDAVTAAKALGITYIGKKKPVIIEMVNAKIDAIAAGEVEEEVVEQEQEQTETSTETTNEDGTPVTPKAPIVSKAPKAPATPRSKGAKWYETTTPLYNAGDIVDIIAGPCLVGRQAQITCPSAKKDAMKCRLINPKDQTLQGTEITMDYFKIQLATPAATEVVVEDKEPLVNLEVENKEDGEQEAV
jgi:hypothetical protein